MRIVCMTLDQINAEGGGAIDRGKFDSLTEQDIERMAAEDGEAEFFPEDQQPTRASRPFQPARTRRPA